MALDTQPRMRVGRKYILRGLSYGSTSTRTNLSAGDSRLVTYPPPPPPATPKHRGYRAPAAQVGEREPIAQKTAHPKNPMCYNKDSLMSQGWCT
jgi:hypothetical protein